MGYITENFGNIYLKRFDIKVFGYKFDIIGSFLQHRINLLCLIFQYV